MCVNKLVLGLKMSSKQTGLCRPSEFNRLVHIVLLVLRHISILKDLMHLFLERYWRERFAIVELYSSFDQEARGSSLRASCHSVTIWLI